MCSVLNGVGLSVPAEFMSQVPAALVDVLAWPSLTIAEREQMPEYPGLYCVVVDGKHLVYVGVSGVSLRQRWRYHHVAHATSRLGDPRVYYCEVRDDRARYWLEIAIMQRFHPVLNGWSMSRIRIEHLPSGDKRFVQVGRPRKTPPAAPPGPGAG